MPSREEPAEGTDLKEPESKRNRKPSEVTARRLAPGDQAAPEHLVPLQIYARMPRQRPRRGEAETRGLG
jgi:hypothetical protein